MFGTVKRSFDHRPGLFAKFMPNLREIRSGGQETGQFTLIYPRFKNWIESIVRGLFFHATGGKGKLMGEFSNVVWEQMLPDDDSKATCREIIHNALLPENYEGANPKVFQYAINRPTSGKTWMCRLQFYEAPPIFITWKNVVVHEN